MTITVELTTEGSKGSVTKLFDDPDRAIEAIRAATFKEYVERHGGKGLCKVLLFPQDPDGGCPSAA